MSVGAGTPSCAKNSPKFPGPARSFCSPWAAMITPTITRTTSGANSAKRSIGDSANVLISVPPSAGSFVDPLRMLIRVARREQMSLGIRSLFTRVRRRGILGRSAKNTRHWLVRSSKCITPFSDAFASCPCYGGSDSWRGGTDKPATSKGVQGATIHSPKGWLGVKVIGAGFGRTGTSSLKVALEELGFGPCYHMSEVFKNSEHAEFWRAAWRGEPVDWDEVLGSYEAAVDWPACTFYAG